VGIGSNWLSDGPYAQQDNVYDVWGNTLSRTGWGGMNPQYGASYTNNKMNGMTYDNSGNLTDAGGGWMFTYDATGQQATSAMNNVQMFYDGNGLRGKKSENGAVTYYLRSSVLGGQVVAELSWAAGWTWTRGYVYVGGEVLAVQQGGVHWMHQDPFAKSKLITNSSGNVVSTIELDPWGGETNRSSSEAFQPRHFTTYERDSIGSHDAMNRRYNRWWARFEQPDPYGGSYDLTDPQSFNRYSYVQNDPVNFVDPTGLVPSVCGVEFSYVDCGGSVGFWGGGGGFGGDIAEMNREFGGMPPNIVSGIQRHNENLNNALGGNGYRTNEAVSQDIRIIWWVDEQGNLHVQIELPIQVTIYIDDPLAPIFGGSFDWSKYKNFGWPDPKPKRAQLPKGMSSTPTTGNPGIEVSENPIRPGIDITKGGARPGATGWERAKVSGALIFRLVIRFFIPGIGIVDAVGPVILPYTIGVCARNPQACDPNYGQIY
jgi:RHS repeat-associated protein